MGLHQADSLQELEFGLDEETVAFEDKEVEDFVDKGLELEGVEGFGAVLGDDLDQVIQDL